MRENLKKKKRIVGKKSAVTDLGPAFKKKPESTN